MRAKLAELGTEPMPMAGAELARYAKGERDRWAKVIQDRKHQAGLSRSRPR